MFLLSFSVHDVSSMRSGFFILVCFVHYHSSGQAKVSGIIIMPGYLLNECIKEDRGRLYRTDKMLKELERQEGYFGLKN